ncbi:alpha/beta hydrolase [Pedobacter sp. WC2423]|uniref:alpha/beta hydrolase n=1 Tax=Pedobacter sp. WC2423 TaxID=3234142 RepID=UPI003466CD46
MIRQFLIFLSLFVSLTTAAQNPKTKLEICNTFFPDWKEVNNKDIRYYSFSVPENWNYPNKKIKLAVAQLLCLKKTNENIVFISGGPGGWSIGAIKKWLHHPLREKANIILIDLRGTGFSQPSLCPDLGKKILNVFSQDIYGNKEINAIVDISKECKEHLLKEKIDPNEYNSNNIAQDIHTLKSELKINKWYIYGLSYGTYIAQLYSKTYPGDVKGLILDSPISGLSDYYGKNTSNYLNSLYLLFKDSKSKFPDLEKEYNSVINKLNSKGLSVSVDKKIIAGGHFTYNADDFKLIIQQSLYNKQLIEVIPLIIDAFNKENKNVLSSLVESFSESLKRDFGTYYCVTCNDVYNNQSISLFDENSKKQDKNGALLFYRSDLFVCQSWGIAQKPTSDKDKQKDSTYKTLIFAGKYDPITPLSNGEKLAKQLKNSYLVKMPYGHGTSFSKEGKQMLARFISGSAVETDNKAPEVQFVSHHIFYNKGIAKLAENFNKPDWLFLSSLIIALLLIISSIFILIPKLKATENRTLYSLILFNSFLGIVLFLSLSYGILQTTNQNIYILLFGLIKKFEFVIYLAYIYIFSTLVSFGLVLVKRNTIKNIELIYGLIFSYILLIIYLAFWGIIL